MSSNINKFPQNNGPETIVDVLEAFSPEDMQVVTKFSLLAREMDIVLEEQDSTKIKGIIFPSLKNSS